MVSPLYFPWHTYTALHLRHHLANCLSPFLGASMRVVFGVQIAVGCLSSISACSNAKDEL